jgi:hypothetical protein
MMSIQKNFWQRQPPNERPGAYYNPRLRELEKHPLLNKKTCLPQGKQVFLFSRVRTPYSAFFFAE